MKRPYFKTAADAPEPLRATVARRVRFQEADPLGVVWHGHYADFFEDARQALGERYGIGYMDLHRLQVATPIKSLHVDHHKPLVYPEHMEITALLHYTEAARMNHEFIIRNQAGDVAATGYTVQLFVDRTGEFLMIPPDFYLAFLDNWKKGLLDAP